MPRVTLKVNLSTEHGLLRPGSVAEVSDEYFAANPWIGDVVLEEVPAAPEEAATPAADPDPPPAPKRGSRKGDSGR